MSNVEFINAGYNRQVIGGIFASPRKSVCVWLLCAPCVRKIVFEKGGANGGNRRFSCQLLPGSCLIFVGNSGKLPVKDARMCGKWGSNPPKKVAHSTSVGGAKIAKKLRVASSIVIVVVAIRLSSVLILTKINQKKNRLTKIIHDCSYRLPGELVFIPVFATFFSDFLFLDFPLLSIDFKRCLLALTASWW